MTILVRVEAPGWTGAVILQDDACIASSETMTWAIGWNSASLRTVFMARDWKATIVRDKAPEPMVEG